jgi:hypothetical protein
MKKAGDCSASRSRVEIAGGVLNQRKAGTTRDNSDGRKQECHRENKWNAAEKVMRSCAGKTLICEVSLLRHFSAVPGI